MGRGISANAARQEPRIKSLTAARFVAAIWVVFYHFSHVSKSTPLFVKNFVSLGFIGVGFFFVLSGFVLTYIYAPRVGQFKTKNFFVARFARIYPVYFLSFVLAAVPLLLDRSQHHPLPTHLQVKLPAYLLMVQSWLPWYGHELNGAAWTLSVEVLFYALFPLALPLIVRMNRRSALIGLGVAALLALIAPTLAVLSGANSSTGGFDGNLFRFFPLIHVPTFLFGAFLAIVYEGDRAEGRYAKWALPLGIVLLTLVVAFNRIWFYYFLHDGGLLIPFGLIIYGMAAREGIGGRAKVPRLLILLGDASYGVYILQFPVFAWLNAIVKRAIHSQVGIDMNSPIAVVAYACFLSGLCVLIYSYFELPARRAIRSLSQGRQNRIVDAERAPASPPPPPPP